MQTGACTRQLSNAVSNSISRLMCPLHTYMLPHLQLEHIAELRGACSASQQLVDQAPIEVLRQAASSALPQALQMLPHDSLSLQGMLKAQAQSLKRLRGNLFSLQKDITQIKSPSLATNIKQGFTRLWWSPVFSTKLLIVQELQITVWNQSSSTWQVQFHIFQHIAVAWCMPAMKLVCYSSQSGTVALLDPNDGSLTSSSLVLYHPDDPIISPKGDFAIVGRTDQDIAVCHLPALRVAWYIGEPGMRLAVNSFYSEMSWIAWAPTGQLLALAGCRAPYANACVSRVRICAASDGKELASFDVWGQYWPDQLQQLFKAFIHFTWASNGDCIATYHHCTQSELFVYPCGVLLLSCRTGYHCMLPMETPWQAVSVTWSACGRFLLTDGSSRAGLMASAVWDTIQMVQIWCGYSGDPLVLRWAPACCNLVTWQISGKQAGSQSRGVQALLTRFPSHAGPLASASQLWEHTLAERLSLLQLSPCGKLIVLGFNLRMAQSGVEEMENVHGSRSTFQLCHTESGPGAELRRLIHVAGLFSPALPDSTTWHPSPIAPLLYAIACVDRSVHLVDGCSHTLLSSWSLQQLASEAYLGGRRDSDQDHIILEWSKDGQSLAMLLQGFGCILAVNWALGGADCA